MGRRKSTLIGLGPNQSTREEHKRAKHYAMDKIASAGTSSRTVDPEATSKVYIPLASKNELKPDTWYKKSQGKPVEIFCNNHQEWKEEVR